MEKRRKILIIDDEPLNLEILRELLIQDFEVRTSTSGKEGIRLARLERPDLIILDLYMPDLDGTKTCEALRAGEATRHIPILILTGALESASRTRAFLAGADDLMAKPYCPDELVARIRSKIRRLEEQEGVHAMLRCGNLCMDLEKYEITVHDRVVHMSVLEFNLLKYFVQNKDRVVSREKILEAVWRNAVVSDRTVDTHMASIRKKLENFDHSFTTVYAAGYVLKTPRLSVVNLSAEQQVS